MRSTMRRDRTFIRCSSSLSWKACSMPPCWRPRCRPWWGAAARGGGMCEVWWRHGSAALLRRVTRYRAYRTSIARQDRGAGVAAWREALAGLEEGTRLALRLVGREPLAPEQIVLWLDPA